MAVLTAAMLFVGGAAWAGNLPETRPVDSIALSVLDNSPQSAINSEKILAAVNSPERDPELYALLGRPVRARRSFLLTLRGTDWEDDFLKLAEVTQHYVTLTYPRGTDLNPIERRLRENHGFGYVGIDQPGNYSATPTDIYFPYPGSSPPIDFQRNDYQWASQEWITNLRGAWDWNKGWAHVGIIDGGTPTRPDSFLYYENSFTVDHADLQNLVTVNHSINMGYSHYPTHGSHVLGLIGANVNNAPGGPDVGGAGVCWHCSIQYATSNVQGQEAVDNAIWLADQGSQVVNLSGGYDPFDMQGTFPSAGIPCSAMPSLVDHPFCHALTYMRFRDVVFVAAAGNSRQKSNIVAGVSYPGVQFPASEPYTIAVGGTDSQGNIWDDADPLTPWPFDLFDLMDGSVYAKCPDPTIFGSTPLPLHVQTQCGSNYSEGTYELDFVAPARKVISTVPRESTPTSFPDFYFTDGNFKLSDDGYAYATGTSMSSPIVAGIVALLRSANPLITREAVYSTLKATASNNGVYNGGAAMNKKAWGVPNAGNAMAMVMGKINGAIAKNRLTPMFVTLNEQYGDHLYSTRPQVILGASSGNYLSYPATPPASYYSTDITTYHVPAVSAYPVFSGVASADVESIWSPYPVASFWVFTSDKSMWNKQPSIMKPLYRMSFDEDCTRNRRHSYPVTQSEIDSYFGVDKCNPHTGSSYARKSFHYDGIEGYIMNECPVGFTCNNFSDPSEPQALYRRFNPSAGVQGMSALIMQGQVTAPGLGGYTFPEPGLTTELIGYVFPNVDSDGDGLPDGMERMYGLNRFSQDSDGDGCPDGIEFPVAGVQQPGKDPQNPVLGGICQ